MQERDCILSESVDRSTLNSAYPLALFACPSRVRYIMIWRAPGSLQNLHRMNIALKYEMLKVVSKEIRHPAQNLYR